MEFLGDLLSHGIVPKSLKWYKAEENKTFDRDQKLKGMGGTFEYTVSNTVQQNGVLEQVFTTLYQERRLQPRDYPPA